MESSAAVRRQAVSGLYTFLYVAGGLVEGRCEGAREEDVREQQKKMGFRMLLSQHFLHQLPAFVDAASRPRHTSPAQ